MLTLEWEPLIALCESGLEDLQRLHWAEVETDRSVIPFAMDWARAFQLEGMGIVKCAAMRRDGELVGYNIWHVWPHIHFATTLHAVNDAIFLRKDQRGSAGVKLILGVEDMLRQLGVVKMIYAAKVGTNLGDIFKRLDYRLDEKLYSKLL